MLPRHVRYRCATARQETGLVRSERFELPKEQVQQIYNLPPLATRPTPHETGLKWGDRADLNCDLRDHNPPRYRYATATPQQRLDPGDGLEPPLEGPKPSVLPLDEPGKTNSEAVDRAPRHSPKSQQRDRLYAAFVSSVEAMAHLARFPMVRQSTCPTAFQVWSSRRDLNSHDFSVDFESTASAVPPRPEKRRGFRKQVHSAGRAQPW